MSLRREIALNWGGKEYRVLITMAVIDRLENHINLAVLVAQSARGDIRFSHAAKLIALLLNEAGCKVTAEDVYEGMFGGGEVSIAEVVALLSNIFSAIFPEPKKKQSDQQTEKSLKNSKSHRVSRGTKRMS